MLQYVRYTSCIRRIGLEANGKDIVAVISGNVKVVGASLVVLELQSSELELGNVLGSSQSKAMELVARFGIVGELSHRGVCSSCRRQSSCRSRGPETSGGA